MGNFRLDNKAGSNWIYIRSSRFQELPRQGQRVRREHAQLMPKIVSPNSEPAIFTMFSAHNYRLVGLEISTAVNNYNLVLLGFGLSDIADPMWMKQMADTEAELPRHITFDRCYIHSTSDANRARTGLLADGKYIAIVDSYISNFKDTSDAQAIAVWQGTGPFKIANNHLEGSGENVLFGGENIQIPNALPSDIEFRGNYSFKRLEWLEAPWTVKNSFELKAAQRVLVSGNVFENNWTDGQTGSAIVFTVRNQYGNNPWATVRDVTFKHNIVRSTGRGFLISGEDDMNPSQRTERILIWNNILENVTTLFSPYALFFQITTPGRPVLDLTISHNLLLHATDEIGYSALAFANGNYQAENFIFDDNILTHGDYGLNPLSQWDDKALNYSLSNNAIVRKPGEYYYTYLADQVSFDNHYGPQNFNVDGLANVGFTDFGQGDYRLKATSPYRGAATDGTDVGPDIDSLLANVFLYCIHGLELTIEDLQVDSQEEFGACQRVSVGPAVTVRASGELSLRAGERIVLQSGVVVEEGGTLEVTISPPYPE